MNAPLRAVSSGWFALCVLILSSGCATTPTGLPKPLPDRQARMRHGYLYYLDGAGGGTAQSNWAAGVRQGLLAAAYPGAGEMFTWETGKGLMADQDASVKYKRAKADRLAREVARQYAAYPDAPIDLLGFSAGTAEVIFALEALPPDVTVKNVVLLGTSISENYDLTKALQHVRGKLYLYTSTHDRMLSVLMPFSGTADRKFDDPGAGIRGFVLPKGANTATRKLYKEKIVTIDWAKTLEKDGDYGRHFDNVKMPFIRDHVAPLLMNGQTR
jgi:pimeloyl-ACP methyl ester carboxylesterase